MMNELIEFKFAVMARKVASRYLFAMEHPTPEAMKQYLKDHPNADPANHSVKKEEKDEGKAKEESSQPKLAEKVEVPKPSPVQNV